MSGLSLKKELETKPWKTKRLAPYLYCGAGCI